MYNINRLGSNINNDGKKILKRQKKASNVEKKLVTPTVKKEDYRKYYCCACDFAYSKQVGNFNMSQSPFFKGN